MTTERTFVLIKPDGVQRGLVGQILGRFEARGLKLVGMKFMRVSKGVAEAYYGEHKEKGFYDGLIRYITSGPAVAMVWEGKGAIAIARSMMGATDPVKAQPGTIRADFSIDIGRNVIHGSDSPESARREISLFFHEGELVEYKRVDENWLTE